MVLGFEGHGPASRLAGVGTASRPATRSGSVWLTADDASDVLRRTAQEINVNLVDLATSLTGNPSGLDDVESP